MIYYIFCFFKKDVFPALINLSYTHGANQSRDTQINGREIQLSYHMFIVVLFFFYIFLPEPGHEN